MRRAIRLGLKLCAIVSLNYAGVAAAQSTDGFHRLQIIPVVVDSMTFKTQIILGKEGVQTPSDAVITAEYYPADGTAQAALGPVTCFGTTVTSGQHAYTTLRDLCPGLAPGSAFGYLSLSGTTPFTAYARVSNAAGIGFSVEANAAHAFSYGGTTVAGVRRTAATATSPAYQTNCFVGKLNHTDPFNTTTTVRMTVVNQNAVELGYSDIPLAPNQMVRFLDVFSAVGMPAGDVDHAMVRFEPLGQPAPGLFSFCTVQDNTSFGADFRIGKHSGVFDFQSLRQLIVGHDARGIPLRIEANAGADTHLIYFRHPDRVLCRLWNPVSNNPMTVNDGLELRLLEASPSYYGQPGPPTSIPGAGGNDAVGFYDLYLGDKGDRGYGKNTKYLLEIEHNERNVGTAKPYQIECSSGSGQTAPERISANTPDQF